MGIYCNIQNIAFTPSIPGFYKIVKTCKKLYNYYVYFVTPLKAILEIKGKSLVIVDIFVTFGTTEIISSWNWTEWTVYDCMEKDSIHLFMTARAAEGGDIHKSTEQVLPVSTPGQVKQSYINLYDQYAKYTHVRPLRWKKTLQTGGRSLQKSIETSAHLSKPWTRRRFRLKSFTLPHTLWKCS